MNSPFVGYIYVCIYLGGCYPPRPSGSVDNTLLDLLNSLYPTQPHSLMANYQTSFYYISLVRRMLRSTFVPETISRRKQTDGTCWTIQTHLDELN